MGTVAFDIHFSRNFENTLYYNLVDSSVGYSKRVTKITLVKLRNKHCSSPKRTKLGTTVWQIIGRYTLKPV